jgi:hypothetical protein
MNNQFPKNEYNKKIFTFTPGELREICSFDAVVKMGDMAKILISNYLNAVSLKRVGVKNSPDIGIIYNIEAGTFDVYEPKYWCVTCKNKKATTIYQDKTYCQTCMDAMKAEATKIEAKKGVKKSEKKGN